MNVPAFTQNFSRDLLRGDRPPVLLEADARTAATSSAIGSLRTVQNSALQHDLKGPCPFLPPATTPSISVLFLLAVTAALRVYVPLPRHARWAGGGRSISSHSFSTNRSRHPAERQRAGRRRAPTMANRALHGRGAHHRREAVSSNARLVNDRPLPAGSSAGPTASTAFHRLTRTGPKAYGRSGQFFSRFIY